MDQHGAPAEQDQATPIFGAYRRGYDPDQVDRYVQDQQRRLDESVTRASEAERRLAAAVGQLRELHRRVAVLESEDRSPQAPALDTLGERVQRILQEAWEGAYALRQSAEQEVLDVRSTAAAEADAIVERAQAKADAMEEATERRRRSFLERIEEDRARAVAQISYLHEQRKIALGELIKVKDVIEATVGAAADLPPSSRSVDLGSDAVPPDPTTGFVRTVEPEVDQLAERHEGETVRDEEIETPGFSEDALATRSAERFGMLTELRRRRESEIRYEETDEIAAANVAAELDDEAPVVHEGEVAPGVFDFERE